MGLASLGQVTRAIYLERKVIYDLLICVVWFGLFWPNNIDLWPENEKHIYWFILIIYGKSPALLPYLIYNDFIYDVDLVRCLALV